MAKNKKIDYSNKILQVRNLRQYFKVGHGKNKITVKAVDDISFDIYKREVFGLVGESGSGKTTTGRSIIKLYKPTDGEVIFDGNIIGKGYGGYIHNIKKAKRTYKLEKIAANPIKQKKYVIKQEYDQASTEIINQINEIKASINREVKDTNSVIVEFEKKLENIKYQHLLKVEDENFKYQSELEALMHSEIQDIYTYESKYIKTSKKRMQGKLSYVKNITENREKAVEEVENSFNEEMVAIKNQTYNALLKVSPYEAYMYGLKNEMIEKDDNEFNRLKSNYVKSEVDKKKVKALKRNHKKAISELKNEYAQSISKLNESKPDEKSIKRSIQAIKNSKDDEIAKLNKKLKELRADLKDKYKAINQDKKNNPLEYLVDKESLEQSKNNYLSYKKEQKYLIKLAKQQNSFRESAEKKKDRKRQIRELKKEYKLIRKNSPELSEKAANEYLEKVEILQSSKPSYTKMVSAMQMIFQDPISSLNPRMIVKDIIAESLYIQGESNKTIINNKVKSVLKQVGLSPDHATRYPHEFSGGQRQRIGIARALISDTKFIIADEPVSALDVSIQAQVINLLNELKESLGLTILFIAHDLSVVKYFSDRIAVMYSGKIVELASSEDLFKHPLHPYTKSLLSAIPHPDPELERKRKRIIYDASLHDYSQDKPKMHEILPGHFIYANDQELEKYKRELKK